MINLEQLRKIYKFGRDIGVKDAYTLIASAKSVSFKKRDMLIEEGSQKNQIFYIRKGLVRQFCINDKGEEVTFALIPEYHMVVNADVLLFEQPSRFYYEALEPTKVFTMENEKLQSIISANPRLEANRKFALRKILKDAMYRVESLVLLSPEERYKQYLIDHPDMVNRVPDKYIANVLGITPVSLSRIRKRIKNHHKS
ncbi:MAG: Crp/Fnr family transcriptional regulator [Saprospiraceae bacterium]|nr:Crp/Fnr family transcriptional regulator [Saprospiraceae bacterium]